MINPFIKVNASGIPRLEAISVDTASGSIYKFKEHKFLNFPYAGLIIFKLPKVATPTAGNVYFTTGNNNSNIPVLDAHGVNLSATDTNLAAGGIYLGWYAEGILQLITGI